MQKLLLFSALVLSLMASPCLATIEFCKDVLEQGNPGGSFNSRKTWDEEWIIGGAGEVEVDIWINDVPENLLTAGIYLEFDASQISILSADVYDDLWDGDMSRVTANPQGPGTYVAIVGNFSTVAPDRDGDIPIARFQFACVENCNTQIRVDTVPGFDSVVGGDSSTTYDSSIAPNVFTVEQGTTTTISFEDICLSETIYGQDSEEVALMRNFRNSVLTRTREGRELIDLYYQWSPALVKTIEADEEFKQKVKDMIDLILPMIAQ